MHVLYGVEYHIENCGVISHIPASSTRIQLHVLDSRSLKAPLAAPHLHAVGCRIACPSRAQGSGTGPALDCTTSLHIAASA